MRLTRPLLLLALAALLAPRAEASRTSVWERNPPAAAVLARADEAGLLASLAPAAPLENTATNAELKEPLRFDLGDVVLVESPREERFRIGLADVVEPPALPAPPLLDEDLRQAFELRDPETRIRGFELLPPFRIGASPSPSLWPRQACGFSCGEMASDSRYDPWGLITASPEQPAWFLDWFERSQEANSSPLVSATPQRPPITSTPDPCNPGPCMRAMTAEDRLANGTDALGGRHGDATIGSGYAPPPTNEEMRENIATFALTLAAAKAGAPPNMRARRSPRTGPKVPSPSTSDVEWRNGWRTPDGKFATPEGPGRSGEAAEQLVWDGVRAKEGWQVIEGRVYVRDATGQLRIYDGTAVSPRGRAIGLEVKSGDAKKSPEQRAFDTRLNDNAQNQATGVGKSKGLVIRRSVEIRPDERKD